MKWKKRVHPMYERLIALMTDMPAACPIGKWQWISEKFSIISPCLATFGLYELYDGEDVYRFKTLREAKKHADTLNNT